jgi:hypothetical protein
MLQGRPLAARAWLERGLPALDSLDAAAGETFVADPKAMLLGLLSVQLLHLGLVQQARVRMQQAYARAEQLRQPVAGMIAIWFDALLRCGWATPSGSQHLPMRCGRLSTGLRSRRVKPHANGFVAGRTLEWDNRARAIGGFERPTRKTFGSGCWRVGARTWGMPRKHSCSPATGTQRRAPEALQFAVAHDERVYLPQLP